MNFKIKFYGVPFLRNWIYLDRMNTPDGRDIPWLLWQLFFEAKPQLIKLAERHDLTLLQMFAVCFLQPGEEAPTNSLSDVLHCDASNVTGIVDKLVAVDAVQRQESVKDRRIKMIQLTGTGQGLRDELLKDMADLGTPSLEVLSAEERSTLGRLLAKLVPTRSDE